MLSKVMNKIGILLFGISLLWIFAVAGGDDFNNAQGICTPVGLLIAELAAGVIGMGIGIVLINGGVRHGR